MELVPAYCCANEKRRVTKKHFRLRELCDFFCDRCIELVSRPLLQHLPKGFLVEADDKFFANPQNWRSQCSRAAQNQSGDLVLVVPFLQIKVDEFLSSCHIKFLHPVQQFERVVAFVADFSSVDFLDRVDTIVRKKLLRFFAGSSARPVITPVNFRHRHDSSRENSLSLRLAFQSSFPRRREPSSPHWLPAFAGMTKFVGQFRSVIFWKNTLHTTNDSTILKVGQQRIARLDILSISNQRFSLNTR